MAATAGSVPPAPAAASERAAATAIAPRSTPLIQHRAILRPAHREGQIEAGDNLLPILDGLGARAGSEVVKRG